MILRIIIATMLLVMISALTVPAQEETIHIVSEGLGPHQRPVVVFQHERHADDIDCARCHHEPDLYGANSGGEGQRCAECHQTPEKPTIPPLMKAFHLQCKGCHEKLVRTTDLNPPRMCGQCHVRR